MPDVSNLTLSGASPGQGQTNDVGNFQMSLLGHFTPPSTTPSLRRQQRENRAQRQPLLATAERALVRADYGSITDGMETCENLCYTNLK